jgi:hypothetical protein
MYAQHLLLLLLLLLLVVVVVVVVVVVLYDGTTVASVMNFFQSALLFDHFPVFNCASFTIFLYTIPTSVSWLSS